MSEETIKKFEGELATLATLAKLIKILLLSAFGIGVWVATLEWRQRTVEVSTEKATTAIQDMFIWKERTEANRFDSKQGADLYNSLTQRSNIQDLKVQRLESGQDEIRRSLARIEEKLGTAN